MSDSSASPRNHPDLSGWAIIGMNHYHVSGQRMLFVAMVCNGKCIKAEGFDDPEIWLDLRYQAMRLK